MRVRGDEVRVVGDSQREGVIKSRWGRQEMSRETKMETGVSGDIISCLQCDTNTYACTANQRKYDLLTCMFISKTVGGYNNSSLRESQGLGE